jgi:hypothetical protein
VFAVRYELSFYILFSRNSAFKELTMSPFCCDSHALSLTVSQFGYLVVLMWHTFSLVSPIVGSVLARGNFGAGKLLPLLQLLYEAATLAIVAGMLHLGIRAPLLSGHSEMQWPSQYDGHLEHCFH